MFANEPDESLRCAREAAVAPVDETQLAPKINAFDTQQFHFAGFYLVARKTFADERHAGVRADKSFDHADAGQFHGDMHARAVRTEELIENLASVAGARKNQRLRSHFFQSHLRTLRQWIAHAHHESQAVLINVMHFQVWRLERQRHDTHVHGAIFYALQNLMAEVAVDADVHLRIAPLEFRKNVGQ